MDLQQTANQIGVRQDLSDVIIEMDASETPAFSLISKGPRPGAPVLQVPVDVPGYCPRKGVKNGTPAPAITDQSKHYALLESQNHMIRVAVGVGQKDLAYVDRAGVGLGKLYSREVAKGLKAAKVAIECITLDAQDQKDETGTDGSETRGLFSWASPTAQSCRPVPERYRPAAAQIITSAVDSVSPETIRDALTARWKRCKNAPRFIGFCGAGFKNRVSSFSMYLPNKDSHTCVRQFDNKEAQVLKTVVDLLEFDTGTVELHLDPYILWDRYGSEDEMAVSNRGNGACIMFPQSAVSYRFAQNVEHEDLANTGSGKEGQISAMFHTMATPFELCAIAPSA